MAERITFEATASVSGRTLSGVAHTFGTRALVGDTYVEFAKGSFDAALRTGEVMAFWQHDQRLLLGSQHAGTVAVEAGADGLHYSIELPNTSYADDLLALVDRGDLRSMSFGITPGKVKVSRAPDGKRVQTHVSVKELFDISPVSRPAFEDGTSIQLHARNEGESARSQLIRMRHRILNGSI